MRTAEGMLAIGLAGGLSPQAIAWFCDLGSAYVGAIAYEEAVWTQRENSTKAGEEPDHPAIDELMRDYFSSLDADPVPAGHQVRHGDDRRRGRRPLRVRPRRPDRRAGRGLRALTMTSPEPGAVAGP